MTPKLVVLTPVKNEAWILDRFLAVTSQFADVIIVSDQGSTDESRDICKKYGKVHLILNTDTSYNEANRQKHLIETARTLVPGPRILLAFDSDEILAADARQTPAWQQMLAAAPGTILYFEKPDLFESPHRVIRYREPWPLGYVDDGCEHRPKVLHSIRVPQPAYAQHLRLHDIKLLHYALTRPGAQRSKMRYYSVLENVVGTTSFYARRNGYGSGRNFALDGTLQPSEPSWFAGWERAGIDMFTVKTSEQYWQDFEILRMFKEYGHVRFWLDDIWDVDWEKFRCHAIGLGRFEDVPRSKITGPPRLMRQVLRGFDRARSVRAHLRSMLFRRKRS